MKKIIISSLVLLSSYVVVAQTIVFQSTKHDFGTIKQEDGDVTAYFEFKNEGTAPLLISNVRTSCGCTRPTWPKSPIEPGATGTISATYRASTRPYYFQKTITVYSNDTEHQTVTLSITGNVTPKPTNPADQYSVKMGDLSLKGNKLNFGINQQGAEVSRLIEYANFTDHEVTLDVFVMEDNYDFLRYEISNPVLQPKQSGNINFIIDTKQCQVGPTEFDAYVMVNNQVVKSDDYKITASINVNEDFSALTEQERREAPIVEVETKIDMGIIASGKSAKKTLTIGNAGVSALKIRRAYCAVADQVNIIIPRNASSIKNGKKANLTVNVNAMTNGKPQEAGSYSRMISIYTNDPSKPKTNVTVMWTVQ